MESSTHDIEFPTSDDIAGVWALYPQLVDDHADLPGNAATLLVPNGPAQGGRFDEGSDVDVFRFSAFAGRVYTITTFDLDNGADTVLELVDSDLATVLARNDDFIGYASRVDHIADLTQTLYVRILPYDASSDGGTYRVQVAVPEPGAAAAGLVAVGALAALSRGRGVRLCAPASHPRRPIPLTPRLRSSWHSGGPVSSA
jgi:hypothetical protein